MALSMGEEHILAEIEHHLVHEDPELAQHLESFGHRPWRGFVDEGGQVRLRRWGIVGAVVVLAALFITMIVAVTRGPGKLSDVQPYRAPAGPAVVVPPAGETTAPAQGQHLNG